MARIRTIKPDFWTSETMARLPYETRLLAIALLNYADDEGFFNSHPALVKAACFPLDDSVSIHGMIDDLSRDGYIRLGKADDGGHVGQIMKFLEHQRIDKPTKSKLSCKSITWYTVVDRSESNQGELLESSRSEGKGKEGKGTTTLSGKPDVAQPNMRNEAKEVLAFLNEKTGKNFHEVDTHLTQIAARMKEGASPTMCRQVIVHRTRKWGRDEKMVDYLRPATLFAKENFWNYVGELVPPNPSGAPQ